MFIVYVLYSAKYKKIYIGYSSNIEARIQSHNSDKNSGWTKNFRPWSIIHTEEFQSKSDAMNREKQLKSARGRKFIWEELIPKI